ncbi:MAG: C_GCAxxG_C_C family protein [Clostridia bacterium]|nr:C_GCAxxG_C_C family protein [Clostridia bacterium]
MNTHKNEAKALFESGAQCAQAAFGALRDITGLSLDDALALSASFGGGIGRMREVCGALSGVLMAVGMHFGRYPLGDETTSANKDCHYRLTQYASAQFKQKVGSIFCYKLLDLPHAAQVPVSQPRTKDFYQSRPCLGIILAAVEVFDELLTAEHNGTLEDLISKENAAEVTAYLNQVF